MKASDLMNLNSEALVLSERFKFRHGYSPSTIHIGHAEYLEVLDIFKYTPDALSANIVFGMRIVREDRDTYLALS